MEVAKKKISWILITLFDTQRLNSMCVYRSAFLNREVYCNEFSFWNNCIRYSKSRFKYTRQFFWNITVVSSNIRRYLSWIVGGVFLFYLHCSLSMCMQQKRRVRSEFWSAPGFTCLLYIFCLSRGAPRLSF